MEKTISCSNCNNSITTDEVYYEVPHTMTSELLDMGTPAKIYSRCEKWYKCKQCGNKQKIIN